MISEPDCSSGRGNIYLQTWVAAVIVVPGTVTQVFI